MRSSLRRFNDSTQRDLNNYIFALIFTQGINTQPISLMYNNQQLYLYIPGSKELKNILLK